MRSVSADFQPDAARVSAFPQARIWQQIGLGSSAGALQVSRDQMNIWQHTQDSEVTKVTINQ
jgi:hypothetical protein